MSINLDVSKNALEKHALTTLTPTAAIGTFQKTSGCKRGTSWSLHRPDRYLWADSAYERSRTDDVFSTDHFDSEKPISGGIFHVTPGDELLTYTYKYHELKYIISGTIILDEKNTGEKIVGEAGDVISSACQIACHDLRPSCGHI